jgi:hypothetical protein
MRTLARSCTECNTAEVVKVAFIGTGSVEFTRNVVTDLCSFPELTGDLDLLDAHKALLPPGLPIPLHGSRAEG